MEKPDFGTRFQFPENIHVEYDGVCVSIRNKIDVRMAEKYEDFVIQQIAMEARAEGISDLTVLNKEAILGAIRKRIPQKPWYRVEEDSEGWACPCCHMCVETDHGRIRELYCSDCGQMIDWEEA